MNHFSYESSLRKWFNISISCCIKILIYKPSPSSPIAFKYASAAACLNTPLVYRWKTRSLLIPITPDQIACPLQLEHIACHVLDQLNLVVFPSQCLGLHCYTLHLALDRPIQRSNSLRVLLVDSRLPKSRFLHQLDSANSLDTRYFIDCQMLFFQPHQAFLLLNFEYSLHE
jgi:hypothetical protein